MMKTPLLMVLLIARAIFLFDNQKNENHDNGGADEGKRDDDDGL
jgi:hypothetical protein